MRRGAERLDERVDPGIEEYLRQQGGVHDAGERDATAGSGHDSPSTERGEPSSTAFRVEGASHDEF
jgi:hypothetical protein